MAKLKNITIGADPELFVKSTLTGKFVSAEGRIGGTKQKPIPISSEGHAIQEDNVMVEFNIPPCETEEEFLSALEYVEEFLEMKLSLQDCTLDYSASAFLDEKYLKTEQAKMFGCDPDLNVHSGCPNIAPEPNSAMRTAGGHIHIGFDNPDREDVQENLIYAMDIALGLESTKLDTDIERKKMYGLAGSFRFQDYGVEYRTLSNFWLKSIELKKWAFRQSMKAVELVNSGLIPEIIEKHGDDIQNAIDSNDSKAAEKVIVAIKKIIEKETVKI